MAEWHSVAKSPKRGRNGRRQRSTDLTFIFRRGNHHDDDDDQEKYANELAKSTATALIRHWAATREPLANRNISRARMVCK